MERLHHRGGGSKSFYDSKGENSFMLFSGWTAAGAAAFGGGGFAGGTAAVGRGGIAAGAVYFFRYMLSTSCTTDRRARNVLLFT